MLTGKCITDEDIRNCWDDAHRRWLYVNEDDARLALSSAPIFGVGDLQGYWRERAAARQRCAMAINAAAANGGITAELITDKHLIALFGAHCECRPLDVDRTEDEHSHDCDTGTLDDIQTALNAIDYEEMRAARFKCAEHWNRDLFSDIYAPLLVAAWTGVHSAEDRGRRYPGSCREG